MHSPSKLASPPTTPRPHVKKQAKSTPPARPRPRKSLTPSSSLPLATQAPSSPGPPTPRALRYQARAEKRDGSPAPQTTSTSDDPFSVTSLQNALSDIDGSDTESTCTATTTDAGSDAYTTQETSDEETDDEWDDEYSLVPVNDPRLNIPELASLDDDSPVVRGCKDFGEIWAAIEIWLCDLHKLDALPDHLGHVTSRSGCHMPNEQGGACLRGKSILRVISLALAITVGYHHRYTPEAAKEADAWEKRHKEDRPCQAPCCTFHLRDYYVEENGDHVKSRYLCHAKRKDGTQCARRPARGKTMLFKASERVKFLALPIED